MDLSARDWCVALGALAAAVLAAAFALEHFAGMQPCHLCILERWPWGVGAAAFLAGAALSRPRLGLAIGGLAMLAGVGLGLYHVGVEYGVFQLPETCASTGKAQSVEDLMRLIEEAPPPCDQVSSLFGVSLAAWNVLASLVATAGSMLGLRARA